MMLFRTATLGPEIAGEIENLMLVSVDVEFVRERLKAGISSSGWADGRAFCQP